MSGILMMVIAIVVLGGAYLLYGRYLQRLLQEPARLTDLFRLQFSDGFLFYSGFRWYL